MTTFLSPQWAFERYEAIRHRLPRAEFPSKSTFGQSLADTAQHFDAYILDAFGVMNRGEEAIAGAVDRLQELRGMGKRLIVLTNAASYTRVQLLAKYHRLGFGFTADEVVSSRDVALASLPVLESGAPWAAAALAEDDFSDSPFPLHNLHLDPSLYERAGGFLLLSSQNWSDADTIRLRDALRQNSRPLVVANPDLVAPRVDGLSLEPGTIAHEIADQLGTQPLFFGKPYNNAFDVALARLAGIPKSRIAMVGDTLHTDVLGGAAAGIGTILITRHGLFRGLEVDPFIQTSGICPNWVVETT